MKYALRAIMSVVGSTVPSTAPLSAVGAFVFRTGFRVTLRFAVGAGCTMVLMVGIPTGGAVRFSAAGARTVTWRFTCGFAALASAASDLIRLVPIVFPGLLPHR